MKAQWKQPDGNGDWEVIHHETSADVVRYSDTTVADVLDNTAILAASSFMESLLAAEDASEAREILRVGRENFYDEGGRRWSNTSSLLSSTEKKFGESSMYLNGSANLRQTAGITLGGKDFAISCWAYASAASTAGQGFFCWGEDKTEGFQCYRDASNLTAFATIIGDTLAGTAAADRPTFPTGQWNHIEVDYRQSDNTFFFFFNGELVNSQIDANFASARTFPFYIGYTLRGTAYFTGYIDEFIITEQLLHSADFTPPSAPYSFDSDTTVALLHFE